MITPSFVRPLLAVLALVFSVPGASADNWTQWRGPAGTSVSRETGLPVVWNEQVGIAWKSDLPEWGDSTPAIFGEWMFVTTQQEEKLLLLKVDKRDGKVVWIREVGTAETPREAEKRTVQKFHRLHNNASPSPVTDGEVVVAHFGNGDLAAYDFDGRQLWSQNLQAKYGTYSIWWGHANSPVLYGDVVISVCMQDSLSGVSEKLAPSYLVAHDKRTGREKWNTQRTTEANAEQCDSYTTPVFYRTPGRVEMIVMGGNQVDAYDPATGKQLWYLPGIVGGRTITGPTLGDGLVYVTQGQKGPLQAVKIGGAGELTRREVAWKETDSTPDTCCPVVWESLLFTVADNGVAKCYDAYTGHVQWKQRLRGDDFKASPLAAEGRIYFLSTKGLATVVAAKNRFEKLAENQLDDETIASPAVSDGRIFIRGRKHLYCLERK